MQQSTDYKIYYYSHRDTDGLCRIGAILRRTDGWLWQYDSLAALGRDIVRIKQRIADGGNPQSPKPLDGFDAIYAQVIDTDNWDYELLATDTIN